MLNGRSRKGITAGRQAFRGVVYLAAKRHDTPPHPSDVPEGTSQFRDLRGLAIVRR